MPRSHRPARSPLTPHVRPLTLVAVALALLSCMLVRPAGAAPIGWQASGGWYSSHGSDAFVGVGARVGLGSITVIPNVEYLFITDVTSYSLNLDGTMSVLPLGVASGYAGAGIGWLTTDPKNGSSHTDTVWDLIAGAGFNAIPLKPFAQLKYVIKDGDDPVVFSAGIRF